MYDIVLEFLKENDLEEKYLGRWRKEGLERGRMEGQMEFQRVTALEMLRDSLNPDTIARYVQMPVESVRELSVESGDSDKI